MAATTADNIPLNTPAPVKCSRAEAMEREMSAAEQMERAKVVMQASQRMPAVGFFGSRYGERWHVNIVALPHNAVRWQLYDAYIMANALGKMVLDFLGRFRACVRMVRYHIDCTWHCYSLGNG